MDVGSVSPQSSFSYQTALQVSGPPSAMLQALNQTMNNTGSADSGDDGTQASQDAAYGAMDSNPATSVLAGLGSGNDSGPAQADPAAGGGSALAMAAYRAQQDFPASAPAAQASPSSTPSTTMASQAPVWANPASATPNPTSAAYSQQAVQAINPALVSLLA